MSDSSEIECTSVPAGSAIERAGRTEASPTGKDVRVSGTQRTPRAHRLVLGDHSKVQITP
ncbi:hypothetical protein [Streptomyces sp. NPDC053427]|uniref:hypothetical protein n=1 Tax=Streptomyces sp. NPDC053427 TaxID=3365701 RepID=UPI0037D30A9B